jgi:hypothetical protein
MLEIRTALIVGMALLSPGLALAATPGEPASAAEMGQWIEAMKQTDRGPFRHIRWFCKDGAVLEPKPWGCKDHGGGAQHGEWTDRVKSLRQAGYDIANIYEDLDVESFRQRPDAPIAFGQMLIEQFLIAHDDGWILRKARFYRGALQAEGEIKGARRLQLALLDDPAWVARRYLPLRLAARLLPRGASSKSVIEVRDLSASLAERDPAFLTLRNRIHVRPEAADAGRVRDYARAVSDAALAAEYEQLAATIDAVYSAAPAAAALADLAGRIKAPQDLHDELARMATELAAVSDPLARHASTARQLAAMRDLWPRLERPESRLAVLRASLVLEDEHATQATLLAAQVDRADRRQLIDWLALGAEAAYGAGLLSPRQRQAVAGELGGFTGNVTVANYKRGLDYAALIPGWAAQQLRLHFQEAEQKLVTIEPGTGLFIQGQLRGGPLFFYAQVLDRLLRDAHRLAGVRHELFGEDAGSGLRPLNPGLARGTLYVVQGSTHAASYDKEGIYLLPETIAELPPVAGILTEGEGNPLSHVQLLARNLGIPNVAVGIGLIERLRAHDGQRVTMAVSPGGAVQLRAEGDNDAAIFGWQGAAADVRIAVDLERLNLVGRDFLPLTQLRATDSGRTVGPKAAKLGELKARYPEAVADGLAIPFGLFRAVLDRPLPGGGPTLFAWMQNEYARLAAITDAADREAQTEAFRTRLEATVLAADPGEEFRSGLRAAMESVFGPDESYGVFVRSDTNVEDLADFTGAGLNLTVPNVVGFDEVLKAITRVWASPFSARSFAWRQSRMDRPEHVYASVLLLKSVPNEKSGVMVTGDLDSGNPTVLSVAVNEGVGGAVDGQAAESLRIDTTTGVVRLLAQATAPHRRVLPPSGGVEKLPVAGDDEVLKATEIAQLIGLARGLPERFPPITDSAGRPAPADIEFGFLGGRMQLFQIRPFLESRSARASEYLKSLDAGHAGRGGQTVDLARPPVE